MLYLLDANVLITAHRDYYPMDRVPQFWSWLLEQSQQGYVKIPYEILAEVSAGNKEDQLIKWISSNKKTLLLDEDVDPSLVQKVIREGYELTPPSETDTRKIVNDPFLIAYALSNQAERAVITLEVSSPSKKGSNRKIPDVSSRFGIASYNTFYLIKKLDFRAR
ncbi:MAG: DUF4411 family protein [Phototrophicaceae bacterium]